MKVLACVMAAFCLAFPVVGAVSLEPLLAGDDAGSGHDAGLGADAVPVLPGVVYGGSIREAYDDRGDDYAFAATAGDVLRFAQTTTNLACWYLIAPSGEQAVLNCATGTNVVDIAQTGTYLLHVTGTAANDYEFGFSLDGSAPAYVPYATENDAGLGGDAPQEAPFGATVPTGVVLQGFIDGDLNDVADVYAVSVAQGQTLEARLAAPGACLRIYDPSGALQTWQCSIAGTDVTIDQAGAAAGTWFVKVDLLRPLLNEPLSTYSHAPIPIAQSYAFSVALDGPAPAPSL